MRGKGYNEITLGVWFNFVYVNHLPNRRAQGDHIVEFEPCKCYSSKQSDALYSELFSD